MPVIEIWGETWLWIFTTAHQKSFPSPRLLLWLCFWLECHQRGKYTYVLHIMFRCSTIPKPSQFGSDNITLLLIGCFVVWIFFFSLLNWYCDDIQPILCKIQDLKEHMIPKKKPKIYYYLHIIIRSRNNSLKWKKNYFSEPSQGRYHTKCSKYTNNQRRRRPGTASHWRQPISREAPLAPR